VLIAILATTALKAEHVVILPFQLLEFRLSYSMPFYLSQVKLNLQVFVTAIDQMSDREWKRSVSQCEGQF